jgi:hypothetical protein
MNVQLKKFNPASMGDDKVCVFIGKRGTGKSTLVTDILYHKKHLPAGVVMSATEEGNHWYQQFIPDLFIYGEYDKDIIERVIDRQRKMVNLKPPPGKAELTSRDIGAFILMDDCMYDRKFLKDSCIRQCFMNGRHWKIFFMLTMQYCMDLSPDLRANVDYVFIARENVIQNREKLYKSFFGIFPNFDMFNQVMTACTENYEVLVWTTPASPIGLRTVSSGTRPRSTRTLGSAHLSFGISTRRHTKRPEEPPSPVRIPMKSNELGTPKPYK